MADSRFRSLCESLNELLQCPPLVDLHVFGKVTADRTIFFALVFENESVDTVVATVHHVVLQIWVRIGGDLEGFVAAASSDYCVRGCDGGDDVLNNTLRARIGDARDVEFFCSLEGFLI